MIRTATYRDELVSAFRAAALDAGDVDVIAVAHRLIVALRQGWKTHAAAADIAIITGWRDTR